MDRTSTLFGYRFSHTDFVRFWVITTLSICCILITVLSLERNIEIVYPQLFYFPIVYATYFYPRRGILLAGICAIAYEVLVFIFRFPDTVPLITAMAQAILFICIAVVLAYYAEKLKISEARYRSVFENSQLGILLFDQNSFRIQLANRNLESILGHTADDLVDIPFSSLFPTEEEKKRFYTALGSSEDIRNFETTLLAAGDSPRWVNLSWSRIPGNLVSCTVIDIDARRRAEQVAAESTAQYRQVTESSPTGILIIGNQKIVYANPTFLAFSGYTPDDLHDKELSEFIHQKDKPAFFIFSSQWDAEAPIPDRGEFRFVTKNGDMRLGALFFTPITRNGTQMGLLNIVDNTEWEKLKESVELDNERRKGIISTVAHELRTPLQPIMGYLNLLMQDPKSFGVTDETKQILDRCIKSVDRERQIINQMLEISVIDSGKMQIDYSEFPVPELVRKIVEDGGYTKRAEISIELPPDLSFDADIQKITMVIDSLISNAITYSKAPRKCWISYRTTPSQPFHRLSIQDNGVGITDAQLDEIFEPVQGVDEKRQNRKYDRIGLSLSIAKKYMQMHGGYISVDSIVNIGSTFTIHLPKKRPAGSDEHAV